VMLPTRFARNACKAYALSSMTAWISVTSTVDTLPSNGLRRRPNRTNLLPYAFFGGWGGVLTKCYLGALELGQSRLCSSGEWEEREGMFSI